MSKQRENMNNMHRAIMGHLESLNPKMLRDCICLEICDESGAVVASEVFGKICSSDVREYIDSKYIVLSDLSNWTINIF